MRSLDDLPPAVPGTTGYLCPVDDCDWYHYEPSDEMPQSMDDVVDLINQHADPTVTSVDQAIQSTVENLVLGKARKAEAVLLAHLSAHKIGDWLRTINRLRELADRELVSEYGQLMAGGGYHVRNPHPDIERIYPLAEWITGHRQHGGRVYRRRVVVVEDWTEVDKP